MSTHDERSDQESVPEEGSEDEFAYYRPRPGLQVWLIIAVAVVIVGIAVLFVYQTGDKKTILSKQSLLPAGAATILPPGCAQNCPNGGAVLGTPARGAASPTLTAATAPAFAPPPATVGAAQPALCPRCGNQAIPLCSRCNSIMQPLGNDLFYCPRCGSVGTILCPYCNARMGNSATTTPGLAAATTGPLGMTEPAAGGSRTGGQFICLNCSTTGLPNWTPTGSTLCPNCGGGMSARTATAP